MVSLMHSTREAGMTDPNFLDIEVGFYRRANGKRPSRVEAVGEILEMVRAGDLWNSGDGLLVSLTAEAMARAGELEDEWKRSVAPAEEGDRDTPAHSEFYRLKDAYGELKGGRGPQTLSAATFGGWFDGCRDSGMRSHSGLVGVDLDHLNRAGRTAEEVRDATGKLPYVAFAFISPSGDGVKVFVWVDTLPASRAEQTRAWEQVGAQVTKDLGLAVTVNDPKAKNLARLCFLGYDPGIYIADPAQLTALHVDLQPEEPTSKKSRKKTTGTRARSSQADYEEDDGDEEGEDEFNDRPKFMRPAPAKCKRGCPWLEERGTQLQGRCPECGGDDRFHVNLDPPHLYECRQCDGMGRGAWPWYAVFRPWYRPGDFTNSGGGGPWECSADADCLRLIRRYADQLLLVDEEDKGKFRLLVDNGYGVWRDDESLLTTRFLLTTREWHRASADAGLNSKTAAAVARWAVMTARMRYRNEALESVATIAGWMTSSGSSPRGLTMAKKSELNQPGAPFIGTPKGVIDLSTGRVLTGTEAREKLITRIIKDDYDPDARHPAVDKLLSHLAPDNRDWLLGNIGWGMRGYPARRFHFLEGWGNDGKSTLFNALLEALGEYAAPPMSNALFNGGRNQDRADAPMAFLKTFQEAPLVFSAEPPKWGFNWELARTISGSDTTNTRQIRGQLDVLKKSRYISTMFFCTNPDTRPVPPPMLTRALYDRVRLLTFPHIPDEAVDIRMPQKLQELRARQALAALVIAHAMRNLDGPPEDSPEVAVNRAQMREASLGEMGMWVTEHVQQTHNQEDILTTDDVWEAAQEAAPGNSEETVWGRTRRQLVDFLKLLLKVQSTRGRVKGKILHYWRGYRLLSDEEIERMEHEEEQQVPGPLVYCRTCKTMILECELVHQAHRHVEETPSGQFRCFLCGEPMPDDNPFLMTCPSCDPKSTAPGAAWAVLRAMSADMGYQEVVMRVGPDDGATEEREAQEEVVDAR